MFFSKSLTALTSAVKYVPEWFPGASFKRFARIAKEKFDDSVNLPFQHVKESFEVSESPFLPLIQVSYWNKLQAETLTAPSIVATCLEELPELSERGVDEEVIRGMSGTIYLGECRYHTIVLSYYHRKVTSNGFPMHLGGEETVSGIPAMANFLLIIPGLL